jgi:hypothetical protein
LRTLKLGLNYNSTVKILRMYLHPSIQVACHLLQSRDMENSPGLNLSFASPSNSNLVVHWVEIPSYVLRGAGPSTHYEYEVRINMGGECWSLLRRYKRFRELHMNMKDKYGSRVSAYPGLLILHVQLFQ